MRLLGCVDAPAREAEQASRARLRVSDFPGGREGVQRRRRRGVVDDAVEALREAEPQAQPFRDDFLELGRGR
jgi:hypothetical protein